MHGLVVALAGDHRIRSGTRLGGKASSYDAAYLVLPLVMKVILIPPPDSCPFFHVLSVGLRTSSESGMSGFKKARQASASAPSCFRPVKFDTDNPRAKGSYS